MLKGLFNNWHFLSLQQQSKMVCTGKIDCVYVIEEDLEESTRGLEKYNNRFHCKNDFSASLSADFLSQMIPSSYHRGLIPVKRVRAS